MYLLQIKPRAILMQRDAYEWYETQKKGLGELFIEELENKYKKIETAPELYTRRHGHYRHITLRKFPYVIVFRVIKKTVVVYAVFHTSRNPGNKLG